MVKVTKKKWTYSTFRINSTVTGYRPFIHEQYFWTSEDCLHILLLEVKHRLQHSVRVQWWIVEYEEEVPVTGFDQRSGAEELYE